jgi:hypothetical protein
MRKVLAALTVLALVITPLSATAAVKAGAACTKAGNTSTTAGIKYTCVKSGKKLVWNKGVKVVAAAKPTPAPVVSPTPSATPTPTSTPTVAPVLDKVPAGFNDLAENFKGVYISAWNSSDAKIRENKPVDVKQNIIVGPKTKLPSAGIPSMFVRGTQFFAGYAQPTSLNAIYYVYDDISWAQDKIFELYANPAERDQIPRNCQSRERCNGANANVPLPNIGHTSMAVFEPSHPDDYHLKGGIEIHEYAHMVQFMQFQGKPTAGYSGGLGLLPNWFVEGHAHTAGNLGSALSLTEYKKFRSAWLNARPDGLKDYSAESIEGFYEKLAPGKFDSTVSSNVYSIGYFTVEALVALKGADSPMEVVKLVSDGQTWDAAFLKVYGITWKEAAPILAKSVSRTFLER